MRPRRSHTVRTLVALCFAASPVSAQITTATVSGTVADVDGGVIPGAVVILVSDTRGTRMPDVLTNPDGDFVFVNVPPDRYTIQVTLSGFKTLKRSGIEVSVGDHLGLGVLT